MKSFGQFIKYDESESIFIPDDKQGIKDIYQITIDVEIKSRRSINTKDCTTIAIDGVKKLKIVYSQDEGQDKMAMVNLQLPYNTFVELPKNAGEIDSISIYILDAYFDLLDKKRIYAHYLYLMNVGCSVPGVGKPPIKNTKNAETLAIKAAEGNEEPQIALSHEDFLAINIPKETYEEDLIDEIGCLYL